jgi:PKHD-type hydroxylase
MLVHIPDVLTAEQVAFARQRLDAAQWIDGRVTAGHQSAQVKRNRQLPEDHEVSLELGDMILDALQRNALFVAAALPLHVFPPLFNRYEGGESFGSHVDNAIRQIAGTPHRTRSALSQGQPTIQPPGINRLAQTISAPCSALATMVSMIAPKKSSSAG